MEKLRGIEMDRPTWEEVESLLAYQQVLIKYIREQDKKIELLETEITRLKLTSR